MAYPSKSKWIVRPAASVALRYGLALVSVAVAQGLAHTFLYFHLPQPLTAFALSAIAITFRYGGTEPGILAALFAALSRSYFFEPEINVVSRLLYDLVFLIFAILMIHFTRERKDLELRVAERTAELTRANEELRLEIVERKRAEETLRLSEERYRLIVENQTEFIVKWLPDGTRTFVNDNYCRMFGIAEADCLGTSFYPLVATEFREEIKRKVTDLTPSKPDFTEEHQSFLPDGQHWQQWMTRGIFDAGGNLVELVSAGRDITQLKQTEEELRQVRERVESILNSVSDTFILFDRQWRYLYLNDAAVLATSRPLKEILGRTLWELFPEVVGTKLDSQFHRSMDEGVNVEFDFHFLHPGIDQWWEIRTYPQSGGGLAVFATDTTERKRADDQLRRLSGELLRSQDAERRKIARDLHDSTGQDLVALATMIGQLRASVPSASRKSRRLLSECKALADKCIRDVRTLS